MARPLDAKTDINLMSAFVSGVPMENFPLNLFASESFHISRSHKTMRCARKTPKRDGYWVVVVVELTGATGWVVVVVLVVLVGAGEEQPAMTTRAATAKQDRMIFFISLMVVDCLFTRTLSHHKPVRYYQVLPAQRQTNSSLTNCH
jgi:hypothetical protein